MLSFTDHYTWWIAYYCMCYCLIFLCICFKISDWVRFRSMTLRTSLIWWRYDKICSSRLACRQLWSILTTDVDVTQLSSRVVSAVWTHQSAVLTYLQFPVHAAELLRLVTNDLIMASLLKVINIETKIHAVKPPWSLVSFQIVDRIRRQSSWTSCKFCSRRRRRRDWTRLLSRVSVGSASVYWIFVLVLRYVFRIVSYKCTVCRLFTSYRRRAANTIVFSVRLSVCPAEGCSSSILFSVSTVDVEQKYQILSTKSGVGFIASMSIASTSAVTLEMPQYEELQ